MKLQFLFTNWLTFLLTAAAFLVIKV